MTEEKETITRTLRVPREIDARLQESARRNRRTITAEILVALDRYLAERSSSARESAREE